MLLHNFFTIFLCHCHTAFGCRRQYTRCSSDITELGINQHSHVGGKQGRGEIIYYHHVVAYKISKKLCRMNVRLTDLEVEIYKTANAYAFSKFDFLATVWE